MEVLGEGGGVGMGRRVDVFYFMIMGKNDLQSRSGDLRGWFMAC